MAKPPICIQSSAILALLLAHFLQIPAGGAEGVGMAVRYLPAEPIEYRPINATAAGGDSRRMLAPFQLCLLCRCCAAGDPANCSSMSCCFGINCTLPDKPYGVCAFVPKTCDCTSCT